MYDKNQQAHCQFATPPDEKNNLTRNMQWPFWYMIAYTQSHAHTLPESIVAYSYSAHPLCQAAVWKVVHHSLLFSVCVQSPSPSQLSTPPAHVFSIAHPSCSVCWLVCVYELQTPWTDWLLDRQPKHTKREEITFMCLYSYVRCGFGKRRMVTGTQT